MLHTTLHRFVCPPTPTSQPLSHCTTRVLQLLEVRRPRLIYGSPTLDLVFAARRPLGASVELWGVFADSNLSKRSTLIPGNWDGSGQTGRQSCALPLLEILRCLEVPAAKVFAQLSAVPLEQHSANRSTHQLQGLKTVSTA